MVRLTDLSEGEARHLAELPCPVYDTAPWADGPPLSRRRVAIISTAGLSRRGDRPFDRGAADYRIIPAEVDANDLVMTHISVNFDRTGFQQDQNVVFPLDRLREMAEAGEIGSVADYHYSFMGATDPAEMEPAARPLAKLLAGDGVDAVLLVPV